MCVIGSDTKFTSATPTHKENATDTLDKDQLISINSINFDQFALI